MNRLIDQIEEITDEFDYMEVDDLTKLKNRYVFNRDLDLLEERFKKT
jgi:PleD family two-component response regulator